MVWVQVAHLCCVMAEQARAEILERIRLALTKPIERPSEQPDYSLPIYAPIGEQDLAVAFAAVFTSRQGELYYVEHPAELYLELAKFYEKRGFTAPFCFDAELNTWLFEAGIPAKRDDAALSTIDVGFTLCEVLIARTGSILVSSKMGGGRRLTIYPPVHVVIAFVSQIVADIGDGLRFMKGQYGANLPSMISMVTGPSRTADIEKTLVLGAHGPKELILFLVDDTLINYENEELNNENEIQKGSSSSSVDNDGEAS
jgi:L-lactate dehydrogenase complex protein LldG